MPRVGTKVVKNPLFCPYNGCNLTEIRVNINLIFKTGTPVFMWLM